jgi:hypothetical protein
VTDVARPAVSHLEELAEGIPEDQRLSLLDAIRKERSRQLFTGDRIAMAKEALSKEPGFEALDPWQEDFLKCQDRRIILNCSRQIGKSTMASIYALHQAMFVPRSLVLIFAPAQRQSQELFKKMKPIYKDLGKLVPTKSEQQLTLELENDSRIVSLPGTEKTTRGFSKPALIIVDEASQIDDELYSTGIKPMLFRSQGQLMLLSTPFGRRGIFYKIWTEGENWKRFRVPATQSPSVSKEFLEEEKKEKPAWQFEQEYMCAFVDNEEVVFPTELIERAMGNWKGPLFKPLGENPEAA